MSAQMHQAVSTRTFLACMVEIDKIETRVESVCDTRQKHPQDRYSKLGFSTPSTIPIPTDMFSEGCWQDLFNDILFDIDIDSDVE